MSRSLRELGPAKLGNVKAHRHAANGVLLRLFAGNLEVFLMDIWR
jgi:hypothetical protein